MAYLRVTNDDLKKAIESADNGRRGAHKVRMSFLVRGCSYMLICSMKASGLLLHGRHGLSFDYVLLSIR